MSWPYLDCDANFCGLSSRSLASDALKLINFAETSRGGGPIRAVLDA